MTKLPFLVALSVIMTSCATSPPAAGPGREARPEAPTEAGRTLVLATSRPPESLGSRPLREVGGAGSPRTALRAFNAGLVINDERELPRPYLAEALPELNTDTWRVLPDGRMDTTYRLRPDLKWHDGEPLTAEDFVFAWRVYGTPEFGLSGQPPMKQIDDVLAPDPRTVVFRWNQPYANGAGLQAEDFPPLHRRVLEGHFSESARGGPEAFIALPFWVTEYVGLGPYRLARFELGAFLEGTAFDGHALGKAKIERIQLTFSNDANTVLANLLAGAAHATLGDGPIDLAQTVVLDREWVARGTGVVIRNAVGIRHANIQLRPEYATPRGLLDVRIRRALAHATDRQSLADALTEGQANIADTLVLPNAESFAAVDRAILKYPYDVRRAEQLFNETGFYKDADGIYTGATEGRFSFQVAVAAGPRNDSEVQIMTEGLRRAGIDSSQRVIPRPQVTEPFIFATFSGILNGSVNRAFVPPIQRLRTSEIATQETRGRGANYSGWNNVELERLVAAYETTLDRSDRNQWVVQIMRLVSEEVPIYALYYNLSFVAHVASLRGPHPAVSSNVEGWNIHEWYWN